MKYTKEQIEIANKTSRNSRAVGAKAITPRVIRELFSPEDDKTILDFGAGTHAAHAVSLSADGYDVTAYEFGDNINPDLHEIEALKRKYDVVYASNVINVSSTIEMLENTLKEIKNALNKNGVAIVNYPASPRKANLSNKEMISILETFFVIERINKNNLVWKMTAR